MTDIQFIDPGTFLFRFMDPHSQYFWPAIVDMLAEQRLFLNSRTKFNDPYDSQPIIENDLSNSAIRSYVQDAFEHPVNPKRSLVSIARLMDLKASGRTHLNRKNIEDIKSGLYQSAEAFLDSAELLSFSLTAENPLLWGHYAASFTGVCAIFRRGTSVNSALSLSARVVYVDKRPRLPLSLMHDLARRQRANIAYDDVATQIFFLSFLHKSNHWAYEQEARIFYPFHSYKKLPFDPNELVGFILGPNASSELETRLRYEIRKRNPAVSLNKSTLSKNEYRILIPHEFAHSHVSAA